MKRIQVSGTGFPGDNDTLRFITEADKELMSAFASALGNLVIISGIVQDGTNYTNGWVAIDGEIMPFTGGAFDANITVNEETKYGEYDQDSNNDGFKDILPIYVNRTASFGTGGIATYSFSDFTRLLTVKQLTEFTQQDLVIDPDYVHTDNNFTTELKTHLQNLVSNVQADWNAAVGLAAILNKPTDLVRWLKKPSSVVIGDVYTDTNIPLSFPSVGTSQYLVVGHLVSIGSEWNYDNDVIWMVRNQTSTGFNLLLKEVTGDVQNLRFIYGLLPYN